MKYLYYNNKPASNSLSIQFLSSYACPSFDLHFHTSVLPAHVLEAKYPGACETVWSLCDCWDEDALHAQGKHIVELGGRIGSLHKSASGYLYAAGSLLGQLQSMADEATNHHKVVRLAHSLAARELHKTGQPAQERVRFVSGITDRGMLLFEDTITTLAPRLYVIDDSWGASSALLLSTLRQLALENGHDVITCACPLFPFTKIDHLLLPQLGLGFVTRNKLHPVAAAAEHTIHSRRFTDLEKLNTKKLRMRFLSKAAANMLEQAELTLAEAKRLHDELEVYYVGAMDFKKVNARTQELIERFLRLSR